MVCFLFNPLSTTELIDAYVNFALTGKGRPTKAKRDAINPARRRPTGDRDRSG
jgi:hypothetical protein